MSLSQVETALLTAAVTALGTIPIEYENNPFTPPTNAKWAQLYFMPVQPRVSTLGNAGEDMVRGIVQINLNYPAGTGDLVARADFETIRTAFKAGTRLTSSSQVVTVTNCGRTMGRPVQNWYRISVSIDWYALIPR